MGGWARRGIWGGGERWGGEWKREKAAEEKVQKKGWGEGTGGKVGRGKEGRDGEVGGKRRGQRKRKVQKKGWGEGTGGKVGRGERRERWGGGWKKERAAEEKGAEEGVGRRNRREGN